MILKGVSSASINLSWFCPLFLSFSAWLMLSPYLVWGNKAAYIVSFVLLIIAFFSWSLTREVLERERITVSIIIFFIIFLYFELIGASIGWAVIEATGAGFLFLIQKRLGKKVLYTFKIIFILSLIPGMIVWCWNLFGLPLSIWHLGYIDDSIVPNQLKVEAGQHYYKYIGSVVLDYMIDSNQPIFRMCAMYDEPGVVGTIAALLLAADKFDLSKNENKILLAGGMMSFSLAFFILVIFTIFFYKKWKLCFSLIIIGSLFLIVSPQNLRGYISSYTVARFNLHNSKNLLGNNRESNYSKNKFDQWAHGEVMEFMVGSNIISDKGASWKNIFIKSGIIGFILLIISLSFFLFSMPLTYYSSFFFLIFCLSIYQRPDVLHFPILLIMACGVANLSEQVENTGKRIRLQCIST